MSNVPPPTYDEQRTQLLICPIPGAIQFQKGYLGAYGEHAAIEGELQIKGAEPGQWDTLKTIEQNQTESIEISSCNLALFSSTAGSTSLSHSIPSTLLFSIPLPADTPQCIHTPYSSISHQLIATLHPCNPTHSALVKAIPIHTRRYTSRYGAQFTPNPHIVQREEPVFIRVELPRTSFLIGEPIPVYVTIPSPDIAVVRDRGLQLRSVMVELERVINVGHNPDDCNESQSTLDLHTVVFRTGSSCRFHRSRPVRIRLILFPHHSTGHASTPSIYESEGISDEALNCASITQSTLLHSVTFRLNIVVAFMLTSTHSESTCNLVIPIDLLPNAASLPEVDESVTVAYRKKHDRPPDRTIRGDDADIYCNEAGPSAVVPLGAPPAFDDREAPPPFFSADPVPSTSSRLPTFLESESEGHFPLYMEDDEESQPTESIHHFPIQGEGIEFGFRPDEQFDGISSSFENSPGPPPSMTNVHHDTDVTQFANIMSQPERALEVLALVLEQPSLNVSNMEADQLPPPPPPLDDPSDPPPSIDVEEFRRPPTSTLALERSPQLRPSSLSTELGNTHAPPPYLQPTDVVQLEEAVMHPPPYVDFIPVPRIS